MARFFGTISPRIVCSATTMISAMANAMPCRSAVGMPTAWNGDSRIDATAGSPIAPRPSEHSVMPS
jgi:hypothetical protein